MKQIITNRVQEELLKGVNILADVVGSTLGPEGRNVIIDGIHGFPHVTKDGVTVAKSIQHEDRLLNMGIHLVKQAADQTAREAGDGTTTSTILARHILKSGASAIKQGGGNPIQMRKGMFRAVEDVAGFIKNCAKPCKEISDFYHVALVSANYNEKVAETVSNTKHQVGEGGQIIYKQSYDNETRVDVISGMRLETRVHNESMLNDLKKKMAQHDNLTMVDPLIFIMDYEVISNNDIVPLLNDIQKNGMIERNVIIICDNMEGEPLATINASNQKSPFKVAVLRTPFAKEKGALMVDICTYTGATLITESAGIRPKDVTVDVAGTCSTCVFREDGDVVLIESPLHQAEALALRISNLKDKMSKEKENSPYHIELKKRLSALTGSLGIISIGASTQSELNELMDIYDDCINAVESASQEGVVYGGGNTFAHAYYALKGVYRDNNDFSNGYNIVIRSLLEPIRYICNNAGQELSETFHMQQILLGGVVFLKNGEAVVSVDNPSFLLDPAKVLRVALRNAVSVASTILTTYNAVIYTKEYIDFQAQLLIKGR